MPDPSTTTPALDGDAVERAGRAALDAYEAIPYDNDLTGEQVWALMGRAALAAAREPVTPGPCCPAVPDRIEGHWLVEVHNHHTCGAGGPEGHEPGCGLVPLVDLRTLDGWDSLVAEVREPVTQDDLTDAALVDLYWRTTGDDWAIPSDVMIRFGRAVLAARPSVTQDDEPTAADWRQGYVEQQETLQKMHDALLTIWRSADPENRRYMTYQRAEDVAREALAARPPVPTVTAEQVRSIASESGRAEGVARDWLRTAGIEVQP